ncbi:MAG TPA: arylsulfotransferase family protein [Solirubrobacteraceae bacterium]
MRRFWGGTSWVQRWLVAVVMLAPIAVALLSVADPPAVGYAAPPRTPVSVYPTPGDTYEMPGTQISFRGVAPSQMGSMTVRGSRTGLHTGRLLPHSDGRGASFVPARGFAPGERVTVTTELNIVGGMRGQFSFAIEHPAGGLPGEKLPRARRGQYVNHFRSVPGLVPASLQVTRNRTPDSDGDIFVAPQFGPIQNGPMIVDPHGNLVWFDPIAITSNMLATDFRAQTLFGHKVLTWWQGVTNAGSGSGVGVILGQNYQPVGLVRAANGLAMDLHEFMVTNQGDAWIIAIAPMRLPGIGRNVQNGVVQEIDIRTGLVLFQWDGMDHVPPSWSYRWGSKIRGRVLGPWHINSVSLDAGGNPVVSMRNMNAVYDINRSTGKINWELGGKHSSFKMGPGTSTVFQHDAIIHPGNQITVFDDGAGPPRVHTQSRGIRIALNTKRHTSRLIQVYAHDPPISANYEGSIQPLPHDNVFLGWGQQPFVSQDTGDGTEDFGATFPSGTTSYRAYRFRWSGQPVTPPSVALDDGKGNALTVYVSWNGATDVARWRVLTGGSRAALQPGPTAAKQHFETAISLHTSAAYIAVQALDSHGQVLATSVPQPRPG